MAKRIFIIVDPDSDNRVAKATEADITLREYDFDVENPLVIDQWERAKVALDLFNENHSWLKRDIGKILRCDGAVALAGFTSNEYEHKLYGILKELPWIGERNVRFLGEWIGETDDDTTD